MSKISVIIPARVEQYLNKTLEEVFGKSRGDIEVIVILDGYQPNEPIKEYPGLTIIHRPEAQGMRAAINAAADVAKGEYLMKLDAHCMVGEGFDKILQEGHGKNWLAHPSKYSLDADKWERFRGPVNYYYLTFPYIDDDQFGYGLHGKKWKGPEGFTGSWWHREQERKRIKIDDSMIFQGSCWFMHRDHFFNTIGKMDERFYTQEAPELALKTWLSGGRVIVNKNTWYAHWHKTKRGFPASLRRKRESDRFSVHYWMNDQWPGAKYPFKWYIDKFRPIEKWPENWEKEQREWEASNPL